MPWFITYARAMALVFSRFFEALSPVLERIAAPVPVALAVDAQGVTKARYGARGYLLGTMHGVGFTRGVVEFPRFYALATGAGWIWPSGKHTAEGYGWEGELEALDLAEHFGRELREGMPEDVDVLPRFYAEVLEQARGRLAEERALSPREREVCAAAAGRAVVALLALSRELEAHFSAPAPKKRRGRVPVSATPAADALARLRERCAAEENPEALCTGESVYVAGDGGGRCVACAPAALAEDAQNLTELMARVAAGAAALSR